MDGRTHRQTIFELVDRQTDRNRCKTIITYVQVGHEPDMVYLPPRGSFVDHDFLKAYCLRSILQHVSPLAVGALGGNSLL